MTEYIVDEKCDKAHDGEHRIKFNGGNPLCIKCGRYVPGPPRVVLPASVSDDGQITVHVPIGPDTTAR